MVLYGVARSVLFRLPPAAAQRLADKYLAAAGATAIGRASLAVHAGGCYDQRLAVSAAGIHFANPLGVAGGVDKNAKLYQALGALGFGHVELGTVTPRPQEPNPGRILWRAPSDEGLVNAMGFPNEGMDAVASRLQATLPVAPGKDEGRRLVLGLNVGPNRDRLEHLDEELAMLVPKLSPLGDYLALNLSSPNTSGLRALLEPSNVARSVGHAASLLDDHAPGRPLLVKASPDCTDEQLTGLAKAAVDAGAAGIIATNTTVDRPPHLAHLDKGGLSGKPLAKRALHCTGVVRQAIGSNGVVVGVGGIFTGADVAARMAAGADLVQAYTGFVYRGPGFAGLVCRELLDELNRRGLDRAEELRAT